MAPQSPMARCRAGPSGNDEVMIASEAAAIIAPLRPWKPRATVSIWSFTERPPTNDVTENRPSAATNVLLWPKKSVARPANIKKPAKTIE